MKTTGFETSCRLYVTPLLLLCLMISGVGGANQPNVTYLGANANEGVNLLQPALLEQSHTTWVRAFIPMTDFLEGRRTIGNDEDLQHLETLHRLGYRIILSFKWDFAHHERRIPSVGSKEESQALQVVEIFLRRMLSFIDILVVANEPYIDFLKADCDLDTESQDVPMVRFLEAVTRRAQQIQSRRRAQPVPVYVGAFTRLDRKNVRERYGVQRLLDWACTDPLVDGLDLHIHTDTLVQFDQALEYATKRTSKPIIITEFSLVWHHKRHLGDLLGSDTAGRTFCLRYNRSPDMRVVDYVNLAAANPVSEAEWNAFLLSRPWFDPDSLHKAMECFDRFGVKTATYAFKQWDYRARMERGNYFTTETTPWFFNQIFITGMAVSPDPNRAPVNRRFMEAYLKRNP